MQQNARQLPLQVRSGSATGYEYWYDPHGNPTHIHDLARGGDYSRGNAYDGLDRLTASASASYGGDHWHRFTYDALDNLKSWKLAGVKDYANYVYDASHRLTNIQNTAGASIVGLGYDAQGNLANKNGQAYTFDYGNRLRETVGKEWYRYDGHGRRVLKWRTNEPGVLSMYGQSGQVFYDENFRAGDRKATEYIYLAGSLISTRARNIDNSAWTFSFQHTDALGSPVAVTDAAGAVIDRTQWEPYGAAIGKPAYDGIGYTGHVMDGATGLTYMQQRYYDPGIGRFLSVDPVTAYSNPVGAFNRYWYANNNPYRFTDPDGREAADRFGDSYASMNYGEREGLRAGLIGGLKGIGAAFLELNSGGPSKAGAGGVVTKGAVQELGVIYKRIDPRTLEGYIGKAKSWVRYLARQGEHNRKLGVKHDYDVVGRAEPGKALSHLEETTIRAAGGLQKEGGTLANKVHAMSEKNFDGFQGAFRVGGRIDSMRLSKEMSGK